MRKAVMTLALANLDRLLKNDASPPDSAEHAQGKDAGSARSSATGATEDDAWRRPVLSPAAEVSFFNSLFGTVDRQRWSLAARPRSLACGRDRSRYEGSAVSCLWGSAAR